ncbi:MAG: acyl-CoA/acyl-ACP dehydrogenase [Chloroflexi bacterium]|nr:acyl-CoA/acyl-ACP dehydrogenase [Chloroflexota bacterium]
MPKPNPSPSPAELLARAEALAQTLAARAGAHDRDGSFPFDNVADLRAAGLHLLPVPAQWGGAGGSLVDAVNLLACVGGADASTALGLAMHVHVVGGLAENDTWLAGKFEQLCRAIVAEGALANFVASEPEMGSPSRGGLPRMTARAVPGGFVLNGRKSWVTFAPALDFPLTTAELDGAIALFAARGCSPGLSLVDTWSDALSLRASGSCDVVYEDVFVPDEWLVKDGRAAAGAGRAIGQPSGWPTLAFAATYLGVAEAAVRELARYCRERVPTALGKPIAELPHVQRNLGRMNIAARSARVILLDAARRWHEQPAARAGMEPDLALAKYVCTNAAVEVTDLALRTAGANGLEHKLPLERLLRDARAGLMHPPQDERAFEILGRAVLG